MPTQEDIDGQQQLLSLYRRTLAQYLRQQAQLGSAYAPPSILNGIEEVRENIRRIKDVLRTWDVSVPDHPDDDPSATIHIFNTQSQKAPVSFSVDSTKVSNQTLLSNQ